MDNSKQQYPTAEELIEALEDSHGIIASAATYLKEKYGYKVHRDWIKSRISWWGMEEQLIRWRTDGVEKAFARRLSNALKDGNEFSIGWMLDRYGHYVDFLQPKEEKATDYDQGAIERYMEHLYESSKASKSKAKE